MRYLLPCFLPVILFGQSIQLAPPRFTAGDVFFKGETTVSLEFALEKAIIQYSFQGRPGNRAATYTLPFSLKSSTTVWAISRHSDFLQSPVVERRFIEIMHQPDSARLDKPVHKNYSGNGVASLFDLKKGSADIQDGNWLGFAGGALTIEAFFVDIINCKQLIISTLIDYNAWILPCRKIVIEGKTHRGKWVEIGYWAAAEPAVPISSKPEYACYRPIKLKRIKTRSFRIKIEPFGNLPTGHPGAGTPAWLFLDEIVFQ